MQCEPGKALVLCSAGNQCCKGNLLARESLQNGELFLMRV